MADKPSDIDVPLLKLNACSVEEHCRAFIELKRLPFWWYQGTSRLLGNYSLPFHDANGNWWFQMKPGFCWPVAFFAPIGPDRARLPYRKTWLGYQCLVSDASEANSTLVLNMIDDLTAYGAGSISSKRRNKIRHAFENCMLEVITRPDKAVFDACRRAWDSTSVRTGWKEQAREEVFDETWRMLLDCPGESIIVARERAGGEVAGFYIVKVIGDTAYSDTIAVRTELLNTRANDALRYAFLANSAQLPGVTKAYSSIVSYLRGLEDFKTSLGFEPHPFPAVLHLRPGIPTLLRIFAREKYHRMLGRYEDEEGEE